MLLLQPGYGQMPMGSVPPQQPFNPSIGASEGSPVHQMHHQQGYGQQPMVQPGQSMYSQPNSQTGYSQAGGQYQPQVSSQAGQPYQQGPPQGPYQPPISTQQTNLPGSYENQAVYQQGGQYSQLPQTNPLQGMTPSVNPQTMSPSSMAQPGMPPSTMTGQGMPQQGHGMPPQNIPQGMPVTQGYQAPAGSNVDYQSFNMQGNLHCTLKFLFKFDTMFKRQWKV